jgi:uncharacterized protein
MVRLNAVVVSRRSLARTAAPSLARAAAPLLGSAPGASAMKTSLEHLPEAKRARLGAIADLFRARVPLGLLVLFGSHARGDWVEDPETGYQSDFDLLAVVRDEAQANDVGFWPELEGAMRAAAGATPVTLIVHDVKFVNREIRVGQYFFADIVNEGVLLYDGRDFTLARPKALNQAERLAIGEQNYRYWFDSASDFWRGCRYYAGRDRLNHAAFLLHQATERYYHAALLVFTGYKEHTHDIEALGAKAAGHHPALADALPKGEPADKHLFDLLKKAYIDARYSKSYRITLSELAVLQARVLDLAARVRAACLEQLASFCGPVAVSASLPAPPAPDEPLLASLPPAPSEPGEFERWARAVAELAEARMREGKVEGLREGEARGEARGKAEGLREGEAKGLRAAVLDACELLGIVPTEAQRAGLEAMNVAELGALRQALKRGRRWPD